MPFLEELFRMYKCSLLITYQQMKINLWKYVKPAWSMSIIRIRLHATNRENSESVSSEIWLSAKSSHEMGLTHPELKTWQFYNKLTEICACRYEKRSRYTLNCNKTRQGDPEYTTIPTIPIYIYYRKSKNKSLSNFTR